ncbi:MAG TPA: family 78 glycoside hydrolase catalytic domain [Verrucomicrobiae bacterium]|nr:family 78 glycoside hydrolase catalytic domain [Verrucomicrobiae bacterium]
MKCCWASIAVFFVAAVRLFATGITDLRCEDMDNPRGIDATPPRLSWIMDSSEPGQKQTAYEILVASSEKNLDRDIGDLWSSGKILSDRSIQIPYAGKPLASHEQCFWKVRIWDKDGNRSSWSDTAFWTMGVLRPQDWHGQWIGMDGREKTNYLEGANWIWYPRGEPEKLAAPGTVCFRRVVVIPAGRKITHAEWVYTGDNECRGWFNGFDLGARNNHHVVRDDDITGRLKPGSTNVFAYTGYNRNSKPAGIIGLLTIEFASGPPMVIPTDESWKASDKEIPGWNEPGFDDSKWVAAKNLGPVGMRPWGSVRVAESRRLPARYLRREFILPEKKIERATVNFCGLGLSELYINGEKIGDAVLSPAFSQYNKRAYYVTYDVTQNIREGQNAIGAILGNGRFFADRSKVYSGTETFGWPKMLLQLNIQYTDGSTAEIVSDGSWKISVDGPIVANNDYDGEEYDARKEFHGWTKTNFNDSAWLPVEIVSAPCETLSAQMQEPIRVTETIKPVAMKEISPGVYIYDMGQNIAGWCRLKVFGQAGTRVQMRYAETLQPDGNLDTANLRSARQTDVYTLRGDGYIETWEPRFTSHGFRYVELTGFPQKASLDSIEGRVVGDDLPAAGTFETSNELLNKIYRAIVWAVRDNYRSIPTDCPQRDERQGWLGDRSEESRGETYIFDNSNLYAKWLRDIADAQKPDGSEPDIAPTYWPIYSDNVSWPSTAIIIPEMLREQFDDTQIIARQYPAARKWIHFMSEFVTNGIISRDSYGDWCVPPEDLKLIHSKDPGRMTDKTLIATAYFYHDCLLMETYARMLDRTADADAYHGLAAQIKTAFNKKFLDEKKNQYDNGTQTSCILPLAFGLVPEEQMLHARIFNHLVEKIENESHDHVGTGLIGGQYLMRVLTDNNRADLAYKIATQKDYPSWGYMIEHGATTIWELWNGNTADPTMNSGNHVMLVGDLVTWLYEDLAGIKPDPKVPGFKHIILQPKPVGNLTYVKATHQSPYGLISSEWHRNGRKFSWDVEIPPNTTATIIVPTYDVLRIKSNGGPLEMTPGLGPWKPATGGLAIKAVSGKYHFESNVK